MKKLFTALNNRIAYATAMSLFVTSTSHAALTNNNLGMILNDKKLQAAITIGFGVFAAYKWFEYFSGFKPESAMINIILPALLTFLTFQWDKVLGWVGIM